MFCRNAINKWQSSVTLYLYCPELPDLNVKVAWQADLGTCMDEKGGEWCGFFLANLVKMMSLDISNS